MAAVARAEALVDDIGNSSARSPAVCAERAGTVWGQAAELQLPEVGSKAMHVHTVRACCALTLGCCVAAVVPCSYNVHVWVDKAQEAVRIDFRDGIDKTYFIKV